MTLVGVKYIGLKAQKVDNVAGTGLIWTQGQIHALPASLVPKFQPYKDVWEIVPIEDKDLPNVGLVIDTLGTTQQEVTQAENAIAIEAAANAAKVVADLVEEEKQHEENVLTQPDLPASFEPMSKAEIAAFAQRNYGLTLEHTRMTKDALVQAVRTTHNSRVSL